MALSQDVVAALPTKLPLMGDVLAPVSLALITEYDEEYLGIFTEDDMVKLPEEPVPAEAGPFGPQTASFGPQTAAFGPGAGASCGSCGETAGSSACASCGGSTTWVLPGPDGPPGENEEK